MGDVPTGLRTTSKGRVQPPKLNSFPPTPFSPVVTVFLGRAGPMTVSKSFTVRPTYGNMGNIPLASVCSPFPASDEMWQLNPGPRKGGVGSLPQASPEPVVDQVASQLAGRRTFKCSAGQVQELGQDIQRPKVLCGRLTGTKPKRGPATDVTMDS